MTDDMMTFRALVEKTPDCRVVGKTVGSPPNA